ncbi:MAG: NAD(P)-binding domain-containing protein [Bdellovibrionota bacterium]
MSEHYEIAIIGAGPAGLSAAASAATKKISHMLFEKEELGNTIYNYQLRKHVMDEPGKLPLRAPLPFKASSREQVLEGWTQTIKSCGVRYKKAEVTAIQKTADGFQIEAGGNTCTAKHVILAIGTQGTPRRMEVPGEDLPHVGYTLADPDAFKNEDILVVGAGDAAIENALALAPNNRVSLLNRSGEFARAKDANVSLILNAIKSGKVRCYYSSSVSRIEKGSAYLNTPDGEVQVKCNRVIARLGSILPRKFLEGCGIAFPNPDPLTVPVVDDRYESNVPGLYILGALIGYPLIKHAINQGFEVIEHILGNAVEPADQVLIAERLNVLGPDVLGNLDRIRKALPLFRDLSGPQFRELISESTVHRLKKDEVIFRFNDYGDSFFNIVSGRAVIVVSPEKSFTIEPGNFFGEIGLLSGRRRTATVKAGENETILLETPRKQILKLISSVTSVKNAIDRIFALRVLQTSIFFDAEPGFNAALADKAKIKNFKKNEILFQEGDEGDFLYVIRKGSVKISRKNLRAQDVAQTYLPAGNYVGEMALLSQTTQRRNATVSAAVPCETLMISKADFLELLDKNPKTKERVLRVAEERRFSNVGSSNDTQVGLLLDFLLKEGVSDADNVLVIDSDLCIGCDNCEKACAATHGGDSRLDRKGGKSFASIQVPISCRHCENPLCMLDCPPDALVRRPDGEVVIKDSCIGCGNCQRNCPYGVIQMVHERPKGVFSLLALLGIKSKEEGPAKAAKCDLCETLSGGPACVRSCPTGAALRMNPKKLEEIIAEKKRAQS